METEKKIGRMMFTYYILQSFIFYIPVLTIFLNYEIKNLFYVSILFSVKSVATCVLEIPTGIIADYISRKLSIILGTALYICSMLIFVFKPEFVYLIFAQLLFGVSETLISGADQALFYDNFKYINKEESYPRYIGNLTFWSNVTLFVAFVLGGIIYSYNKRIVFLLTAIFMGLSLLVLIPLKEYPYKGQEEKKRFSVDFLLDNVKKLKHESRKFWFYLIWCSIIEAFILSIYLYLAPIMLEMSGVKAEQFGFVYAICSILYGFGSKMAKNIKKQKYGFISTVCFVPFILVLQYWTSNVIFAVGAIGIMRMLWGLFDIIFKTQIHAELKTSEVRATVFSLSNSIVNLVSTVTVSMFGWILTRISYTCLMAVIVCMFVFALLCFSFNKTRDEK